MIAPEKGSRSGAMSGLRGRLLREEPMARHTSWRVGGPAERCFEPADTQDLAAYLRGLAPREPLLWLGLGSNLLVRDGGLRGSVILTSRGLSEISLDDGLLRLEAGVPCAKAARYSAAAGLEGAEFLIGIPGTMGGALAMNAGAFGGEMWRMVVDVETINRAGKLAVRSPADYQVAYRSVQGPPDEWFVAVRLELRAGDPRASKALIKEFLKRRGDTQPTGVASCGSVFRNPPDDHAGRLIEACGLKGHRIGGACVSEKHANFILNLGSATATDIERLILHVRDVVAREQGVQLTTEVHIVGDGGEQGGGDD